MQLVTYISDVSKLKLPTPGAVWFTVCVSFLGNYDVQNNNSKFRISRTSNPANHVPQRMLSAVLYSTCIHSLIFFGGEKNCLV